MSKESIMVKYARKYNPTGQMGTMCRDRTQVIVKEAIARLIRKYAKDKHDLLEIGGCDGWQTVAYRDQLLKPRRSVIYDWRDFRTEEVKREVEFCRMDLEKNEFPDPDSSYDVVVCNQVLEHLKNIYLPLSEMCRVLRVGGVLIVGVPNISALHNCALILVGQQPATMKLFGSHVRGYAIWSMSKFLETNHHLRIKELKGYGLHPLTSKSLPGPLRTFCHTSLWLLQKQASTLPMWEQIRKNICSTTNF